MTSTQQYTVYTQLCIYSFIYVLCSLSYSILNIYFSLLNCCLICVTDSFHATVYHENRVCSSTLSIPEDRADLGAGRRSPLHSKNSLAACAVDTSSRSYGCRLPLCLMTSKSCFGSYSMLLPYANWGTSHSF